ncbi:MAG: hypothetical protein K6B72_08220 [Lachnospiraceae bacterium]|nr:hypothetical protein [Lachnospiraceae bacterium]
MMGDVELKNSSSEETAALFVSAQKKVAAQEEARKQAEEERIRQEAVQAEVRRMEAEIEARRIIAERERKALEAAGQAEDQEEKAADKAPVSKQKTADPGVMRWIDTHRRWLPLMVILGVGIVAFLVVFLLLKIFGADTPPVQPETKSVGAYVIYDTAYCENSDCMLTEPAEI